MPRHYWAMARGIRETKKQKLIVGKVIPTSRLITFETINKVGYHSQVEHPHF